MDNAVATLELLMTDASVAGWGLTSSSNSEVNNDGATSEGQDDTTSSEGTAITMTREQLLDTSNGPAVYIFASPVEEDGIATFAMARESSNIREYAESNNGIFTLTILNTNDKMMMAIILSPLDRHTSCPWAFICPTVSILAPTPISFRRGWRWWMAAAPSSSMTRAAR